MTKTELKLIEKIGRAKTALEKMGRVAHSDGCPVEYDPEGYAPCNCGASSSNCKYREVLDILNLDDLADE